MMLGLFQHQESILSTSSESSKYSRKRSKSAKFGSLTGSQGGVNTSSFDLSSQVVKNDYFSDINPRSMRRLMNIVAVTGMGSSSSVRIKLERTGS